ncbi:hypothetical protein BD410DRAFT_710827 [Rickenella mellea]|uniref:THO complex subunit 2 n=1 Tax=Rickenella mellea TaxID=50990 RepID=A0A4R5XHK9_9AGAM|nr:hypothetical protein BD410DRAFT_710827 [Rickenella mellea]
MDVISTVKNYLANWSNGGQDECRHLVTSPHCNPTDANCVDVLTATYETLIHATLISWSPSTILTTTDLVAFLQTVLLGLPSSSASPKKSSYVLVFGELLVDLTWAIDSELDEILADAKIHSDQDRASPGLKDEVKKSDQSESALKAVKARQNAEQDKEVLAEIVRKLLIADILEPSACRERLDMNLLTMVGLIQDKALFEKKEIRTRTGLFYKQNKFNLLREQSEGYAKLTTDLVSSLGLPHSLATGLPTESPAATESRAQSAWDKVISLIGYFDLDPNRALDIILDVFSANLASHYDFFLSLLSFSPWAGDSRRLVQAAESRSMPVDAESDSYRRKDFDDVLSIAELRSGRQPSNILQSSKGKPHVLAQVLGFKFTHYQSPEVHEPCPKNLYIAAALLIRERFLTLEDLYPHLSPADDDMPSFHHKYLESVKARLSAANLNALAMAAPLESSSSSSSKAKPSVNADVKKVEPKETPNQKAMIVTALLSIGELRPAIALLTKFPWLTDCYREIADLLLRVMSTSLAPLYNSVVGKKDTNTSFLQPRMRYSTGGVVPPPPRKAQLTLIAPCPPSTHVNDFVFFYPHWAETVPLCTTMDDLRDVIEPMMKFTGFHVSRDPLFLTKLLRIGKVHLSLTVPVRPETEKPAMIAEPDHPTQQFWLCMARQYLLPALSMMPGNAVCTVEVWNILKQYETTTRWRLYGEWKDAIYNSHPELKAQHTLRERETNRLLRRLSFQTIESFAGTVAKMAHSNPCIFFTKAVHQIKAYATLSDVVIQALRYATNMGFDILVYIILDALADPSTERVKDDGVYASHWLQNLAMFTGALFRRYSSDLTPLLKYIVHQLYSGQTTEIIVLEKLILKMAGIGPLPSISDTQITAMAGGPTLRIETVASEIRGAGFDTTEVALKGTSRLGKALMDTQLAFPLLVQVAQQRQACVFRAKDAHLKSIAGGFDTTHGVLLQYLDLLSTPSAVPLADYRGIIPSLADLCNTYGISPPIALQVLRPLLNDAIYSRAVAWIAKEQSSKAEIAEAAEKRLKAALAAKRDPANSTIVVTDVIPVASAVSDPVSDAPSGKIEGMDGVLSTVDPESLQTAENPWLPELFALFEDCKKVAPGNTYDVVGPGFYLTFWQMSSYDIFFPKDKYDDAEKLLSASSELYYSKYRAAERSYEKSTRQQATNHRNQRDRFQLTITELQKEKALQEAVVKFTNDEGGRLDREKQHWFSHVVGLGKVTTFVSSLIEHCIQPRCLLSPMDADFCVRIIKSLHLRGTPGFPTLMCYDKLLGEHVKVVIFSCSESEAHNYGRFLKGILKDLYHWHKNEKAFDEANRLKDGGKNLLLPGFQKRWSNDWPSSPDDLIRWSDFKSFLKKCHRKLGRQSFTDCIQAGDFMHVYNAIIVLKEIIEVFPVSAVNEVVGSSIDLEMQRFTQSEERGDLKVLAQAYASSLKRREALWEMPKTTQPILKVSIIRETSQLPDMGKNFTAPSGPRPQGSGQPTTEKAPPERPASTRQALESIPKPEVVRRVRPDNKPPGSVQAEGGRKELFSSAVPAMDKVAPQDRAKPATGPGTRPGTPSQQNNSTRRSPRNDGANSSLGSRKDLSVPFTTGTSRPTTPVQGLPILTPGSTKDLPYHSRPADDTGRPDLIQAMPPPSEPRQTHSAQELRSTAKQTTIIHEDKQGKTGPTDGSSSSPYVRSNSPPTRPGTRNPSADSRASAPGEKSRSDRGGDTDTGEDRRASREGVLARAEPRERGNSGHRDVIHGRSERNGRDRIPGVSREARESEREKDADRERDRVRDRDKDRERDRDRDKGRDRDRDRERDRDRDRDRDRHRRDEKERDREHRKDRESYTSSSVPREPGVPAEHGLPTRPDMSRNRAGVHPGGDETLGKRRRPADDDPERGSKRGSRREAHREERSRRPEKEGREHSARDPDRSRRKDRDPATEGDTKGPLSEKVTSSRSNDSIPPTPLKIAAPPPSAPRAMASPRTTRNEGASTSNRDRGDSNWNSKGWQRDAGPQGGVNGSAGAGIGNLPQIPLASSTSQSLRSRIGDKDPASLHSPTNPGSATMPLRPASHSFDHRRNERTSHLEQAQHTSEHDDHDHRERDGAQTGYDAVKKRTLSGKHRIPLHKHVEDLRTRVTDSVLSNF